MTDPESTQAQPSTSTSTSAATGVAGSVLLIILAVIVGAGALVLVVFGAWPAAILLLVALGMAAIAKRRLRKIDAQ